MKSKKLMSVLLLLALLLSLLAACAKEDAPASDATEQTQPTEEAIPDEFRDVDELTPVNGVYQIVSEKGLRNMAEHPEAKFELLRDIDLGGAELTPVGTESAPFSGSVDGKGFTVRNFTLAAANGTAGFFGCLTGSAANLTLADYEIVLTGSDVTAAGGLVGVNRGTLRDCATENGVIRYSGAGSIALGSLAGRSEHAVAENVSAGTDLVVEPTGGSVVVGGLSGVSEDDSFTDCDAAGRLLVTTGSADCTVGLFGGEMSGTTVKGCKFAGPMNTVDGEFYNVYAGSEANVTFTDCYWRDNTYSDDLLDETEAEMRQRVVDEMLKMANYEWTPSKNLVYYCPDGDSYCSQIYIAGITYHGMPYTHNWGTFERFRYCFNEDGTIKDWVPDTGYDGWDMYIGNDCSGAVYWAWNQVSDSISFNFTWRQVPYYPEYGCIAVGDYDYSMSGKTNEIIEANGADKIYECYSQLHKGDAVVGYHENYHHTRLVAEVFTYRTRDGALDPKVSCVVGHGQGEQSNATAGTTWWVNHTETFEEFLTNRTFLPITIPEYAEGAPAKAEIQLTGATEGRGGLLTGTISSNYSIKNVTIKITDNGEDVWDYTYFTGVSKYGDGTVPRSTIKEVELGTLAVTMTRESGLERGKTYHALIEVLLGNDETMTVKDTDFEW